jgi:hypothetical protein
MIPPSSSFPKDILSKTASHGIMRHVIRHNMKHLAAGLLAALIAASPAYADEPSKCAAAPPVLWGDGEHDDTAALNAWFRGETVLWAQTHEAVGSEITDHNFLLSSTVYIHGGTGRKMERFRRYDCGGQRSRGRTGRRWHH